MVSNKNFKVSPIGCHDNKSFKMEFNFLNNHLKIISVKFACNWPSGLGGDVV